MLEGLAAGHDHAHKSRLERAVGAPRDASTTCRDRIVRRDDSAVRVAIKTAEITAPGAASTLTLTKKRVDEWMWPHLG